MVFGTYRNAFFCFALACFSLLSIQSVSAQEELVGPIPAPGDTIPYDIEGYPSASIEDTLFKYPQELIADQLSCLQNEIPLSYNNTVQSFINYFTIRKRSYIRTMLSRKHIYFPLYERTLQKNNLPDELKYLSIVESGLNPRAVSPARAVGLWQFMSYTGREYGLQQDAYIDERMDPVKATQAGCRYLQNLYNMFGDWELAMSAYNCGPGNVRRAIRRSGNKTAFWDIYPYLPRETRSYVPMFVAVTYVMNHHRDYNIRPDSAQQLIAYDTIHVNQHLDLELFAKQLNVPLDDFKLLNPQLKRNVVPAHFKNYPLRVPQDALALLAGNRQAILDSAAHTSSATAELLAAAETAPQRHASASSGGRTKVTHKVTRGDALGKIADYYNVAVADIRKWNKLRGSSIRAGQRLAIWVQEHTVSSREEHEKPAPAKAKAAPSSASSSLAKASTKGKVYRVQPGDTLWSISKGHGGISVDRIKKMNKLRSNELKPGQRLILG
ncbi:MAG TPA: transglycosylase SLT domain-containing protein [Cytophagales bacterium]